MQGEELIFAKGRLEALAIIHYNTKELYSTDLILNISINNHMHT